MPARVLAPALTVACLAAGAAAAERSDAAQFDVYLGGFRVGHVSLAAAEGDGRYSAEARIESAGLAGLLRRVRYDARAEGQLRGGRHHPMRYEEEADTGRRQSRSVMEYEGGVPRIVAYESNRTSERRGTPLDPAGQGGTLDPMTALYLALRDVVPAELCALDLELFDGRRRSRMWHYPGQEPVPDGDGAVTCRGEYRRIEGFTLRDMGEMAEFPFAVTYQPDGEGRHAVAIVRVTTLYGQATLVRR
ncbi:MAG: DUF3108 domain-containing protein [Rhodobacteraceae bacterium]|jgi:hypothetical protein|nr:DUF3108 domain-containing protein [Paracoccaceae bacterium]